MAVAASYVSASTLRLSPNAPHDQTQLAGKIETKWKGLSVTPLTAVNHGVSGTTSGGGRTSVGAPNARVQVSGITRFEGEVMGAGYPWNGGEPQGSNYPNGGIPRVRAFTPGANDFVYVSMGTNDPANGITDSETEANLEWMIDRWAAAGRGVDHFILTTLAPRNGLPTEIPLINDRIRSLASRRGVHLIDLATRTSNDNGASWSDPADHVGDGIHYSEAVRDWLGNAIVGYVVMVPIK